MPYRLVLPMVVICDDIIYSRVSITIYICVCIYGLRSKPDHKIMICPYLSTVDVFYSNLSKEEIHKVTQFVWWDKVRLWNKLPKIHFMVLIQNVSLMTIFRNWPMNILVISLARGYGGSLGYLPCQRALSPLLEAIVTHSVISPVKGKEHL